MDRSRAEWLLERLRDEDIGGRWRIERYVNHGKSGAVFECNDGSRKAAIKLFDPSLVELHGEVVIAERVNRELLVGRLSHPNLVRVYDAGKHGDLYYLTMEYIDAPALDAVVGVIPRNKIRSLIRDIASAAEYLEAADIVHRDIKPANIAILQDYSAAKLLDFGVVRTRHLRDVTGSDEFLGTKRYAPPEFIRREERDSLDGWRAITIYQIGGVLHDLIMRQKLFAEYDNDAQLISAIMTEYPRLTVTDVAPDLVALAESCLVKDPSLRLRLVNWDSFRRSDSDYDPIGTLRTRVATRRGSKTVPYEPTESPQVDSVQVLTDLCSQFESSIRRSIIQNNQDFPPFRLTPLGSGVFRVLFHPSQRFALDYELMIYMRVAMLDAISRAITIEAMAVVCNDVARVNDAVPRAEIDRHLRVIYEGVFSDPIVAIHIEQLLYKALDASQSVEAGLIAPDQYVMLL